MKENSGRVQDDGGVEGIADVIGAIAEQVKVLRVKQDEMVVFQMNSGCTQNDLSLFFKTWKECWSGVGLSPPVMMCHLGSIADIKALSISENSSIADTSMTVLVLKRRLDRIEKMLDLKDSGPGAEK